MPISPNAPAFIAGRLRNDPGLDYLRHEAP